MILSDAEEKGKGKFNEIQDIKSQVLEIVLPNEQESEDGKTLDQHSEGVLPVRKQ